QIGVDGAVPILDGGFVQRAAVNNDARVRDYAIETPMTLIDLPEQPIDLLRIGDVGGHDQRRRSARGDQSSGFLEQFGVDAGNTDFRTLSSTNDGDGSADAGLRPCDDDDLAGEWGGRCLIHERAPVAW